MVCALPLVMSNILPKKSWHVYNDKNREKVKKDEASARIEKEKSEERSKAAEREHRLTILRSRASIASESPKGDSKNSSRFKLFNESEGNQDPLKGEFERELELKGTTTRRAESQYKKKPVEKVKCIESEHWKNDPMAGNLAAGSRKKTSGKDYSFV